MRITRRDVLLAAGLGSIVASVGSTARTDIRRAEVFGHRGACALRPEHTLAAYAKAIADGADYIEPDLVSTKDGVLVARHENEISETTDVAVRTEFATRRNTKIIDGKTYAGWFVSDFTLAELKTLRAKERIPEIRSANTAYDGMFQVPSFEEIIDFVATESATRGKLIGLIPELKNSTFFASIDLPLEDRFLDILDGHEYTRHAPLEIQSFEIANLKYLRGKLGHPANVRLMQLVGGLAGQPADAVANGGRITFADMTRPAGLKEIAAYADVVAPPVRSLIPVNASGHLTQPTSIIQGVWLCPAVLLS